MIQTNPIYRESRELLRLAIPLAGAQVAQALTGFVDTLMMGRLGTSALAAGGLAGITFMTLITVVGAVMTAVTPLIAEADALGKKQQVVTVASQGVYLVLFATVPVFIITTNIEHLLLAMGQDPAVVALADTYLDLMAWGCFPTLGLMLLRGIVSGLAHARPILSIAIWGTLFNVVSNYILAFGKLGLPTLGISGLAIASVLANWGMFLALEIYTLEQPQLKTYRLFGSLRFEPNVARQLLRLGIPIGLFIALESGLFAVVTYLMGTVNTETLAAHQIVLQTVVIIFMVPLGISLAATIRVGQSYGRQDVSGIQRAAYISVAVGAIFNLLVAIAICFFFQLTIGLYLDLNDPNNLPVIEIAIPMLIVGVVALILDGTQKIVYGVLQGLQDTKIPVLLSIPAFWGIGLTLGYILCFSYGMGGVGLWIGQSLGLAIAAVLFVCRTLWLLNRFR